ncbi:myb-like protein X isoform X2 [Trichogramma pretiosum]|uniref:myb-like protein X isoform X2 n=1 Tax=Trichogramma pretiosum TaxID=7493 RepID=UPI0006C94B56|nr:myb-like protein X isoform X2 [Trichogramma pretiosum]
MNNEHILQQHQDVTRAMDETSLNTSRKRPIIYSSSEDEEFTPSKCKKFVVDDKENVTNNIMRDTMVTNSDTSKSSNDNSFAPWSSSVNVNRNLSSSSEGSVFHIKLTSDTQQSSQFSVIKNDFHMRSSNDQIDSSVDKVYEDCNATQSQPLTQNEKSTDDLIFIKDEMIPLSSRPNNKDAILLPPTDSKDEAVLCTLLSPLPPSHANPNDTNPLTTSSDQTEMLSTLPSSNHGSDDQSQTVSSTLLNNQNEMIQQSSSTNEDKMLSLPSLPSCEDQNEEGQTVTASLVPLNDQNEEGGAVTVPLLPLNEQNEEEETGIVSLVPLNEQNEEEDEKASLVSSDNQNQEEEEQQTVSLVPLDDQNEEDEKASISSMNNLNEEEEEEAASLIPLNDQDEDEKASLVSLNNQNEEKEEETASLVPLNNQNEEETTTLVPQSNLNEMIVPSCSSNQNEMMSLVSKTSHYEKQTNIQISNGQFEPSVLCKVECITDKSDVELPGPSTQNHERNDRFVEDNSQSILRNVNHQINNCPQSTPIRNVAVPGCSNEIIAIDGHDPKTAVMNLLMSTGQYNTKQSAEDGEYSRNDLSSNMMHSEVISGDNEDISVEQTHDTSAAVNEFLSTFTEENAGLNLAKLIISLKMDIQELVRKIDNQENILATVVKANELTLEPLFAKNFNERYNLKVPFSNLAEFTIFNENLTRNVRFCNEFIASLTAYIDNHQSFNKNILNMIKKYLSRELAMKFTASKPTGTKMVLKDTMFCSCLLQATKMTMRNGLTPLEHDRLFYKNLGTAVSSAKNW